MIGAGSRGNTADCCPLPRNYRGYRSVPGVAITVRLSNCTCCVGGMFVAAFRMHLQRMQRAYCMDDVCRVDNCVRSCIHTLRLHNGVLVAPVCHLFNVTISSGRNGLGNTHTSHCGQFIIIATKITLIILPCVIRAENSPHCRAQVISIFYLSSVDR